MGHREECQWGYRRALCCVRQEHANLPSAPCARCRIHRASKQLSCACVFMRGRPTKRRYRMASAMWHQAGCPLAQLLYERPDRCGAAQLMRDVALSSGGGGAP